jgi:hypothetical protein
MDNPIINSIHDPLYIKRTEWLKNQVEKMVSQPFMTFDEITDVKDMGIYLIYDDQELLYVGMTTRKGSLRLSEIAKGFRSHTFNRKLLAQHFRGLGHVIHVINPKTFRKLWIETQIIPEEEFKAANREINKFIKTNLRFRFYESRFNNLEFMEHFAIATLQPLYND